MGWELIMEEMERKLSRKLDGIESRSRNIIIDQ